MQFLQKTKNFIISVIILIILISSFFILKFALQKEKIYTPKMIDNQIFTDFEVEELIDGKIVNFDSAFIEKITMSDPTFVLAINDPLVLSGMFLGGIFPFLVSSMTMTAVGDAAFDMIKEIRRQFKEIPGLLEGKAKPDTAKCVDIATQAALRKMILPGSLAVLAPVVVGFLLGPKALGGMLGGALICCVMMALMMSNAGGAWDNAKKYVEKGNFGGKGSEVHKAAVVGDTVGDPLKDTSGPSMNILINVMAIVSLVIAPLLI